ncbi:MAG: hypothetical protein NVSMB39_4870 [Candidatus Saccharimonadales bacterium]
MSRNQNKSDILSGVGAAFEVVSTLQKQGVSDADLRRILSDPTHAAQVAAAMRSASANASFAELVKSGKFEFVNDGFKPEYDVRWTNKGDRIHGEFVLVNMGRNYRESDLRAALARESKRLGRSLQLATAYEGAYYASHGWNGTDWVTAFGSSFAYPLGYRNVAYLWSNGAKRKLGLDWADNMWNEHNLVLCVCE